MCSSLIVNCICLQQGDPKNQSSLAGVKSVKFGFLLTKSMVPSMYVFESLKSFAFLAALDFGRVSPEFYMSRACSGHAGYPSSHAQSTK